MIGDMYVLALVELLRRLDEQIVRVHDLIACPTCHARVDEACRTKSGRRTLPHDNRLAPRLCPCGGLLAAQRRYCDRCRDRTHRANTYAGVVRWRAQRKAAA